MITFTFIRHGESVDNIRTDPHLWAGWRDSPLTMHGVNQAEALGTHFATTQPALTIVFASPLQRAKTTAEKLYSAQAQPELPYVESLLLREQHWGIAEGKPALWKLSKEDASTNLKTLHARGVYPRLVGRKEKFPEGESADDLAARADKAVNELLMPMIWKSVREGTRENVAVVSHGLCISELIPALLRKQQRGSSLQIGYYAGLRNTAWSRVVVTSEEWEEGKQLNLKELPPLVMEVTHMNSHEHLYNLKRQRKIGSAAHDANQKDIRAFFGGGGKSSAL